MTRLTILEYPDPRLRTKASPVGEVDAALRQLIDDMLETMYAAKGVGLAATQVNVHQRLLVTDVSEAKNEPLVLVNPEVLSREEIGTMQEGCLSVPGYYEDVNRAHRTARAIRAGVVWVNTFDAGDITSPFGGFKQSGFGRDKSLHALDKYTDQKAIWIQLREEQ